MTLSSSDMNRLWKDSSPLHGRNHKGWLAEALNAVRSTGNARVAMELLRQMRRDVTGEQERTAIDDVVGWLERRVRTEPNLETTRLLLELGWLRRMSLIRAATHPEDGGRRAGRPNEGSGQRRSRSGNHGRRG